MKVMAPKLVNVQAGDPGAVVPRQLLSDNDDFTAPVWGFINAAFNATYDTLTTVLNNSRGSRIHQAGLRIVTGSVYQITWDIKFKTDGATRIALTTHFHKGSDFDSMDNYEGGIGLYFTIGAGAPVHYDTLVDGGGRVLSIIITDLGSDVYRVGGTFRRVTGSITNAATSLWISKSTNFATPAAGTDVYIFGSSLTDDTTTRTDPLPGTLSNLISTNVDAPGDGENAWDSSVTYTINNRVYLPNTYRVYECIAESSINQYPPDYGVDSENDYVWLDVGMINAYQMFEPTVDTFTSYPGEIDVVLAPGKINSFGLLGLDCSHVQVVMTDPIDGIVYDHVFDLEIPAENYFEEEDNFVEIGYKETLVKLDVPIYEDAQIQIRLYWYGQPTKSVRCGLCLVGIAQHVGRTLYGPRVGILDFSRIERDDFGGIYLDKGRFADRMECDLYLPTRSVDIVKKRLVRRRGVNSLWIGDDTDG